MSHRSESPCIASADDAKRKHQAVGEVGFSQLLWACEFTCVSVCARRACVCIVYVGVSLHACVYMGA